MHATKGHLQEVSRHYYSQSFINLTFTYFEISKYKKQYLRKIITNILTCCNLNKKIPTNPLHQGLCTTREVSFYLNKNKN